MVPAVTGPIVRTFDDLASAAAALAAVVVREGANALDRQGRFTLVLSGGSSPIPLFRSLASTYRDSLPWDQVDFLWADERAVPPEAPESNYGLAARELLAPLGVPSDRIHRIRGEALPLSAAAEEYETLVRRLAGAGPGDGAGALDLALLGMGPDGHTASLFPGAPLLEDRSGRWVAVEPHPGQPPRVPRLTLTLAALNRSRVVAFLVAGAEKQAALPRALAGSTGADGVPAGRVHGLERTEWFVDRVALPAGRFPGP
jgi:6-phosphogluconolactonase